MADGPVYAERMFSAPIDLGIAQEDRAVCSVPHGTSSYLEGGRGEGSSWYEGGGSVGERAVQGITIYPPTRGVATQGDPFEPVKIGVLIDMDLGQLLADWIDPTILAIEDALNEGVF
jgi:branched-chain amino acid transport system substrate-binding protein